MTAVLTWLDRQVNDGKLIDVASSKIDAVDIPDETERALPKEDVHVFQLAVAGDARWIVTSDRDLVEGLKTAVVRRDLERRGRLLEGYFVERPDQGSL